MDLPASARAPHAVPPLVATAGALRGWGLDSGLRAEARWAAARPAVAPALLAVLQRPAAEPLHAATKVPPDRRLLPTAH